ADESRLQLHLHGCRRADPNPLVTVAHDADGAAVVMGRLYYRHEQAPNLSPLFASDAAWALAAYRKWGVSGVERLEGDFCVVIWDAESGLLLAARDPLGGFPLFRTEQAAVLAVSTGLGP